MVGSVNDFQLGKMAGAKALDERFHHESRNHPVSIPHEVNLGESGQLSGRICRVERAVQGRHPVMIGPGDMVQVAGHRGQSQNIAALRRRQGSHGSPAGKTDQNDSRSIHGSDRLVYGLICGSDHWRAEAPTGPQPCVANIGRSYVLARPCQVEYSRGWVGSRQP